VDVKSFNAEGRGGKRRVSQRNAKREMQREKCKERNTKREIQREEYGKCDVCGLIGLKH
jgi:hypothetical protein